MFLCTRSVYIVIISNHIGYRAIYNYYRLLVFRKYTNIALYNCIIIIVSSYIIYI